MDYEQLYGLVAEQDRLVRCKLLYDLIKEEHDRLIRMKVLDDYRLCKALAACYELHDYFANCVAEEKLLLRDGE